MVELHVCESPGAGGDGGENGDVEERGKLWCSCVVVGNIWYVVVVKGDLDTFLRVGRGNCWASRR